jgi:hypothetical protein
MTLKVREHFKSDVDLEDQQDLGVREGVRSLVSGLDVTTPDEVVTEIRKKDNIITLAPGTYGGFTLEKEDTLLESMAALSEVNRQVSITKDCVIDGVTFVNQDPDHVGILVKVNATSTVMFRGCVFHRTSSNRDASLVDFASGGRGIFIGCLFKGTIASTAQTITNPAAASNVQVVASYNKTSGALAQANLTAVLS